MNIAVLGCGPSGLLAAHAANELGHNVVVYSMPQKSEISGAMFMHTMIPGLSGVSPEMQIEIVKSGIREGYAENVYGDPEHPVSWDKFEPGLFPAWDLRKTYDKLWWKWQGRIIPANITLTVLASICEGHDKVISSIPAPTICIRPKVHVFDSQKIWIKRMEGVSPRNVMHYNGWTADGKYGQVGPKWYRYSQIQGHRSWEYSIPIENGDVVEGYKPIFTNCDCWPRVMKVGRFGAWRKQVLTHHVWNEVFDALQ